ncbi:hypothetical protein [Fodinisporobacter ferrooxydans]
MEKVKKTQNPVPEYKLDNKNTRSTPTIDTKEMSESRNRIKR